MRGVTMKIKRDKDRIVYKEFSFEVKANDDSRIIQFKGSTGDKDRMGEIIKPSGWKLNNYKRNPVFLGFHNYHEPPIGKAISVEKTDNALTFDIEFADAETYAFADTIYKLYKGGFMKAVSVGFIPLKWEDGDSTTDDKGVRRTYLEQELLELSAVSVPANANALMNAVKENVITEREAELFEELSDIAIKRKDMEDADNTDSNDDGKDTDIKTEIKQDDNINDIKIDEMTARLATLIDEVGSFKAGKVISKKTRERITQFMGSLTAIREMIGQLEVDMKALIEADDKPNDDEKNIDELAAFITDAIDDDVDIDSLVELVAGH